MLHAFSTMMGITIEQYCSRRASHDHKNGGDVRHANEPQTYRA